MSADVGNRALERQDAVEPRPAVEVREALAIACLIVALFLLRYACDDRDTL